MSFRGGNGAEETEPKVYVELSFATYNAIKNIAHELDTQNNRATAKPYFLVIQTEHWRVAHDEYHCGETKQVWVDTSGEDDYREWDSPKEYGTYLIRDCGFTAKDARRAIKEHLEEFTMEKFIEEENVFLTDKGFAEHIRLNGHNLGRRGEYHTYMKHAFRNPEMDALFSLIAEVGKQ